MGFLDSLFGTELGVPARMIIAFIIVLVLIAITAWAIRKISAGPGQRGLKARQPRLGLIESAMVDQKRRLLLVRRDNTEHLILIGGSNDLVIESCIDRNVLAAPRHEREAARPEPARVEPPRHEPVMPEPARMPAAQRRPAPAPAAPQPARPATPAQPAASTVAAGTGAGVLGMAATTQARSASYAPTPAVAHKPAEAPPATPVVAATPQPGEAKKAPEISIAPADKPAAAPEAESVDEMAAFLEDALAAPDAPRIEPVTGTGRDRPRSVTDESALLDALTGKS